jgi:hypothetical protein
MSMAGRPNSGMTNGLAQADDQPLDYFFRYASNHFDALADLAEAREGDASEADVAFLEYFADSWREMAKAQAEKYAFVIAKNDSGKEVLDRLGLSHLKDVPEPNLEQRGRRRRKARLVLP